MTISIVSLMLESNVEILPLISKYMYIHYQEGIQNDEQAHEFSSGAGIYPDHVCQISQEKSSKEDISIANLFALHPNLQLRVSMVVAGDPI